MKQFFIWLLLLPAISSVISAQADTTQATSANSYLRAQLKARQSTLISSEMNARISQLKLHDGERFSAGQVLVSFHCTLEQAQLSKAQASFDKKLKTFEVDQRLASLHSIGGLELAVAKAETEEAKADVRVAEAVLERCEIKAPFAGKVADVIARPFQSVRIGDPLIEILDDKTLEIEFMAPSRALLKLKPGKHFQITLDETAQTYQAEITRLGGKVDPVSQTIKVYGRILGKSDDLLPGMSGAVELPSIE
ncbi:MAG: efflux RND transporter periplasmic adaptor subunit [Methylococcales bacterium]|nr:efflux RND transporter periplasmic adaptor subunit [Methylococcales bacterium]